MSPETDPLPRRTEMIPSVSHQRAGLEVITAEGNDFVLVGVSPQDIGQSLSETVLQSRERVKSIRDRRQRDSNAPNDKVEQSPGDKEGMSAIGAKFLHFGRR